MEYRGPRQDAGVAAEDLDPKVGLLEQLNKALKRPPMVSVAVTRGSDLQEAPEGKIGAKEANYTDEGPYPLVCGNCKYFLFDDSCQLVDQVCSPDGSCRFFDPKPAYVRQVKTEVK